MTQETRRYRAGEPVRDLCRACKTVRDHTVIAADGDGRPLRVTCDFCGSQHHYRGAGDDDAVAPPSRAAVSVHAPQMATPLPIVTERERISAPMPIDPTLGGLESMLRRVIREESGLTSVVPADKWRGGQIVLRPGKPGLQEKTWPIETFFHKIVMLRNRLRTLEQQVNASDLPDDQKVRLQTYVTGCYGSLTSFNVLFADEGDQFRGSGGGE
jgi:hypothetical protein